jgi:hypothetical protein
MQHEEAKALRESWGDKPCDHPAFEDKYLFGSKTGDFFCSQCGQSFTQRQKAARCRQASNPKLEKFLVQSNKIKELQEKIVSRKDRFAAFEKAKPDNEVVTQLLKDQEALLVVLDQALMEVEKF